MYKDDPKVHGKGGLMQGRRAQSSQHRRQVKVIEHNQIFDFDHAEMTLVWVGPPEKRLDWVPGVVYRPVYWCGRTWE